MKKAVVIVLFALLLVPFRAYAQDALQYTTVGSQHQPQSQAPDEGAQPAETTEKPAEGAQSTGAVIDKMGDAFYINCLRKTSPDITQQDLQGLCECTAKRMKTEMTPEQIKIMAQNDEAGRQALNHMLLEVYAPCMNYPVQSMVEKQCHSDPKTENLPAGLDREKICYCMAQRTGQWFTGHGRELMQAVIAKDPNVYDPVGPIMDDPSFKKAAYDNLSSCILGGSP